MEVLVLTRRPCVGMDLLSVLDDFFGSFIIKWCFLLDVSLPEVAGLAERRLGSSEPFHSWK